MAATTQTVLEQPSSANGEPKKGKMQETSLSLTGTFKWEDVLIPESAGKGSVKRRYQLRSLALWALAASAGLYVWYTSSNTSLRVAGLGLVFPGAGFFAVGGLSMILGVLTLIGVPVVLFAWFGAGGLAFPSGLWIGSILLAAFLAGDSLLEFVAPVWVAVCVGGISYITYLTQIANAHASSIRKKRNEYLVNAVRETQTAGKQPAPGSRELDLQTLRFLQWSLELGLAPKDDFSYHDIIDQFQTSAIRYQLYETVSDLGLYQYIYAPNFHGYLSQAQRNCIEKSFTERVMSFWKYESMWGKGKFSDWDPIKKDDIMVSGYILQAVGIYQSNTGDQRYTHPGSMTFEVTKNHKYPYDFKMVADAVYRNWDEGPYCLFSCEPNWIYTPCNLTGTSGMTLADRLLNVDYAAKVKSRFEKALSEEFTEQDGSIMTIRSELTGWTIPGIAGRLADGINSLLCAAYLPHVAHRNWAFVKQEVLKWNSDGRLELKNLVGADNLDAGNYKNGAGSIRAILAAAAAEYGDTAIRDELLRQLDEECNPVYATKTGATKNKKLSTLFQGTALKARLGAYQDWTSMITKGPPKQILQGPILDAVTFPDVLVAKAYYNGESLDLVLYPGKEAGQFKLGFSRLAPEKAYTLGTESLVADGDGKASCDVHIDGRTALKLVQKGA